MPTYLVTGILMLFILGYGRRYFVGFIEQFDPRRQPASGRSSPARPGAASGTCSPRSAHASSTGSDRRLVCWGLDLPASRSLGVAVGVFTVLPLIGVLVGGVPALLLAFGLEGLADRAGRARRLLVLQAVEAAVVRPVVDARTVRLGPTVPIVVGLIGFEVVRRRRGGLRHRAGRHRARRARRARPRTKPAASPSVASSGRARALGGRERPQQRLQQQRLVGVALERFEAAWMRWTAPAYASGRRRAWRSTPATSRSR